MLFVNVIFYYGNKTFLQILFIAFQVLCNIKYFLNSKLKILFCSVIFMDLVSVIKSLIYLEFI